MAFSRRELLRIRVFLYKHEKIRLDFEQIPHSDTDVTLDMLKYNGRILNCKHTLCHSKFKLSVCYSLASVY